MRLLSCRFAVISHFPLTMTAASGHNAGAPGGAAAGHLVVTRYSAGQACPAIAIWPLGCAAWAARRYRSAGPAYPRECHNVPGTMIVFTRDLRLTDNPALAAAAAAAPPLAPLFVLDDAPAASYPAAGRACRAAASASGPRRV